MIIIRNYKQNDKDSIVKLWQETAPRPMMQKQMALPAQIELKDFELFFVAEQMGKIISTCKVSYDPLQGWFYSISISPQSNEKSIYPKLIHHATSQLHKLASLQKIPLLNPKGPEQMHEANKI